jgi:hypothetical protein
MNLALLALSSLSFAQDRIAHLTLQFAESVPSGIEVIPAVLKYNKEFAYSFTFDDSRADAFSLGFKFFAGGISPVDGQTYPGLFYSDGCGNKIPFRAGVAWVTANQDLMDLHLGTPSYITYTEAKELLISGWDFFNHSYNHKSYSNTIDYHWQLTANNQAFKANVGSCLNYCVPPSGDTLYLAPAFSLGALACFSSNYKFTGFGEGIDVTLPILEEFPVFRRAEINSDDNNAETLKRGFEKWVETTGLGTQKWKNDFTHRIEYYHIGGSMEFPEFRDFFQHLEREFGSKGKDNGWFASSAEVFEYLILRDKVKISLTFNGSLLDIALDYSHVPKNFRYYDLSLIVKGAPFVERITSQGPGKLSHSLHTDGHLINISLPESFFAGAESIAIDNSPYLKGYPNPANENYHIIIPENLDNVWINMVNSTAEVVPCPPFYLSNGVIAIDLQAKNYPPGLYLFRVFSKDRFIGCSRFFLHF